jgi:group I intron endonuclease
MIGIYKITSPKGKVYIGQSRNIKTRLSKYKNLLCPDQPRLYRSIKKHSWESHTFEIIEECEFTDLNTKERFWQDFYHVLGNKGLNCNLTATENLPKIVSKETKEKQSKAMKGLLVGSKNPMFGKEVSKETRDKISKANIGKSKGKKISDTHKEILSKTHKNKIRTFEERLQQSQTLIQQYKDGKEPHQANLVLNTQTGVFYNSILEASKFYHIKYTTLRAMIMGQNPNTSPFIYC